MPRPLREDTEGALHHVYARGNDHALIYRNGVDRELYLALLRRVAKRQGWQCMSYCLMPNHVHLLLETPQANLAAGMQRLHGAYAQLFNLRYDRDGHLFQGRYGNAVIGDDAQFLSTVSYIAVNPVSAGLCAQPEDWRWSSHAATLTPSPPAWLAVDRLFSYLGAWGDDPLRHYADAIAARMPAAIEKGNVKRALRGQTP
jgi:REP element-mobilizing transposase RayT